MRLYETVYILRPELEEELLEQTVEQIQNIISEGGGEVKNLERWGKKRLAYKVQKERYGYYVLMHFEAESDLVKELERHYRLSEEVMKYLTIRITKGEPAKIDMDMEEFEERDKRGTSSVPSKHDDTKKSPEKEEDKKVEPVEIEGSGGADEAVAEQDEEVRADGAEESPEKEEDKKVEPVEIEGSEGADEAVAEEDEEVRADGAEEAQVGDTEEG